MSTNNGLQMSGFGQLAAAVDQRRQRYIEILEISHLALLSTVNKLYAMIRNGKSWELAEPELNDRGLPVVYDIAEKLGCIRPSSSLLHAFPEGIEDLAVLLAQLLPTRIVENDETSTRNNPKDSVVQMEWTDPASCIEFQQSYQSNDCLPTSIQQQSTTQKEADQNRSLIGDCSSARPAHAKPTSKSKNRNDSREKNTEGSSIGSVSCTSTEDLTQLVNSAGYTHHQFQFLRFPHTSRSLSWDTDSDEHGFD